LDATSLRNVPLAPLTTLGLGGAAARMVTVKGDADLVGALEEARSSSEPVFVLGGGSNVVVGDEGFAGLVVRVASRGVDVERRGSKVRLDVAAGEDWDDFVARAVAEGWSGIESLAGIPGLVGGTPIQNVGAYGHEVNETILSVRAFDRETRAFTVLAKEACAFGYRTSLFRGNARYVVTRVLFELDVSTSSAPVLYGELARTLGVKEGERASVREVRRAVRALRRSKGMVVDPRDPDSASVGSFFVNPTLTPEELGAVEQRASRDGMLRGGETVPRFPVDRGQFKVPAAWLVERAGFARGYGRGGVGISSKHSLALVHRGQGTTRELIDLAREIRSGVRTRFGVELHPEPVFVGCAF
jgi:UDP-N-acetylmuramate dehydrogenase